MEKQAFVDFFCIVNLIFLIVLAFLIDVFFNKIHNPNKKLPKVGGLGEFSIETNLIYFFTIKNSDLLFLAYSSLEQGLQITLGSDSP